MHTTKTPTVILLAERPSCCYTGWSGSCGGTCDYAAAEQERAERQAER